MLASTNLHAESVLDHPQMSEAAKAEKGKWAWIGAGVGAGAGAGVGAVKYSTNVDDSELWIGVGLILGTGIGAVTGMLFGQSKRKRLLVYATN
jgi:hypothetical protein